MSKEENILLEEISKQKKQIELLQFQCRKAGKSLVDQEVKIATLIKDDKESGRLAGFGTTGDSSDLFIYKSDFEDAQKIVTTFKEELNS